MPQMSPMMWMYLFNYFIFMLLLIMILMNFIYMKNKIYNFINFKFTNWYLFKW